MRVKKALTLFRSFMDGHTEHTYTVHTHARAHALHLTPSGPTQAVTLNNMAMIKRKKGDYDKARIQEKCSMDTMHTRAHTTLR